MLSSLITLVLTTTQAITVSILTRNILFESEVWRLLLILKLLLSNEPGKILASYEQVFQKLVLVNEGIDKDGLLA